MKQYLYRLLSFIVIFIFSFFLVHQNVQASTYGSGTYGSGVYGGSGTVTPTSTPSSDSSNSSSSSSGGSGSASCTDISPSFSPDLYQINGLSTQATLYFAPISGQYTGYIINYGYDSSTAQFGTTLYTSFSSGAIKSPIYLLNPNTIYYFRVRAINNCAVGPWSNIIGIKTSPFGSNRESINYKASVTFINNSIQINNKGKTILSIPVPFTRQPAQNNTSPQTNNLPTSTPPPPAYVPPQPSSSGNWFDNAIGAVKGFFGF